MFRSQAKRLVSIAVTLAMFTIPKPAAGQMTQPATQSCDHACLTTTMSDFVTAMTSRAMGSIKLSDTVEIRENARIVPIDRTGWQSVKTVRSMLTFADAVTSNVVSRAGVELVDGKAGYISTRLKITNSRITDVELSVDTSARVVSNYVWNLDPSLSDVLPSGQRLSRIELEALARRYFHSLSTHVAVPTDFDARCNRFHSGQQITNVSTNQVEGGPPRTCAGSLEGSPPWGPATEQRFPVIDPERGIVFGVTLLHYPKRPNQPQMYVSEIFKVVSGRIVKIDNIGLMMEGIGTLGFIH